MLQKISAVVLSCVISATGWGILSANDNSTTSEAYIPSENIMQIATIDEPLQPVEQIIIEVPVELQGNLLSYIKTDDYFYLQSLIEECESRKTYASQMADSARNCGYPEDHPIILLAKDEWYAADQLSLTYRSELKKVKFAQAWEEYPIATEVWLYLTNAMGYSNYVAAGIMGNMMVECGGFSLNLDWTAINAYSKCYGICQWHPKYHKEVQGANLKAQLDYAAESFPKLLSRYASSYKEDFSYKEFLQMTDVREIAKAFCLIYERPGGYDNRRGECAVKAYNYFVK